MDTRIGMITQVPASSSVPVSFLESAISKGAVCLDGTAPAYAYVEGSGDGAHSWIVYLDKANLSFRGARIFDVMMEEMLSNGMANAKQAILSGSSAGGLAAMLNCDKFHKLFPGRTEVKCISDSGFFLHGKDLFNAKFRESFFAGVIETHELAKSCDEKENDLY